MHKRTVDVAVIGAGTAGMVAYRSAKKHSEHCVIIESGVYGTTCARVGCMPSKLLIAAAEAAHHARGAQIFGVHVDRVTIDKRAVLQRVQQERDRFVGFVLDSVNEIEQENRLIGHARFLDEHTILVGDHTKVKAKAFVIATGSRVSIPTLFKDVKSRLLTSDTIFELNALPNSVAVFGTGVIGLELGQALSRLGVRVKLFGRGGKLGIFDDSETQAYALKTFQNELDLDVSANAIEVMEDDDGVHIQYQKDEALFSEQYDFVLAATGRTANIDTLDLHNTSVAMTGTGAPIFDHYTLQTTAPHIFIAGDANRHLPLLHEAADEGRIAGDNAGRYPDIRAGQRKAPFMVAFTDPQIAKVGMTKAVLSNHDETLYAVGQVSFEDQGRSRVMNQHKGLLKVYGEQGTGIFLGAEMFGPSAEHLGHLLAWARQQRMTVSAMLSMPFYHPVIEEGLRTALRDLSAKLLISPGVTKNCIDCGPGA